MKIELWYDPIYTETQIRINGVWQDSSDMYGFLYPVRGYPLQTWLRSAGSWTGIERQLMDLSRGEKTELEFHGRDMDYQDFSAAVTGMEGIRLIFAEWNAFSLYLDKIGALEESIGAFTEHMPMDGKIAEQITKFREMSPVEEDWLLRVASREELQRAERDDRICCAVDGGMLDSLEALAEVGRLSRSLRRPMDAICCVFSSHAKKEAFASYALEFPGMQFMFAAEDGEGWKEKLWAKYGQAGWIKKRLQKGAQLCGKMQIYLEALRTSNDKKRMELVHRRMESGFGEKEEKELQDSTEMAAGIRACQKTWRKLESCMAEHLFSEGTERMAVNSGTMQGTIY